MGVYLQDFFSFVWAYITGNVPRVDKLVMDAELNPKDSRIHPVMGAELNARDSQVHPV